MKRKVMVIVFLLLIVIFTICFIKPNTMKQKKQTNYIEYRKQSNTISLTNSLYDLSKKEVICEVNNNIPCTSAYLDDKSIGINNINFKISSINDEVSYSFYLFNLLDKDIYIENIDYINNPDINIKMFIDNKEYTNNYLVKSKEYKNIKIVIKSNISIEKNINIDNILFKVKTTD